MGLPDGFTGWGCRMGLPDGAGTAVVCSSRAAVATIGAETEGYELCRVNFSPFSLRKGTVFVINHRNNQF